MVGSVPVCAAASEVYKAAGSYCHSLFDFWMAQALVGYASCMVQISAVDCTMYAALLQVNSVGWTGSRSADHAQDRNPLSVV